MPAFRLHSRLRLLASVEWSRGRRSLQTHGGAHGIPRFNPYKHTAPTRVKSSAARLPTHLTADFFTYIAKYYICCSVSAVGEPNRRYIARPTRVPLLVHWIYNNTRERILVNEPSQDRAIEPIGLHQRLAMCVFGTYGAFPAEILWQCVYLCIMHCIHVKRRILAERQNM